MRQLKNRLTTVIALAARRMRYAARPEEIVIPFARRPPVRVTMETVSLRSGTRLVRRAKNAAVDFHSCRKMLFGGVSREEIVPRIAPHVCEFRRT